EAKHEPSRLRHWPGSRARRPPDPRRPTHDRAARTQLAGLRREGSHHDLTDHTKEASMRDQVRFLSVMVALMLSASCAPSSAPSGSDAGRVATGAATTTPSATVSSPPANPDAAATPKVAVTLIKNVRTFDGKAEKLSDTNNVMVRGNIIERVSSDTIQSPAHPNVTV